MQTILHQRNKIWYVILRYEDLNGKIKDKRISTHCEKKSDAQKMIGDIVIQYAGLESASATPNIMACDYFAKWKAQQIDKVQQSTYEGYDTTNVNGHLENQRTIFLAMHCVCTLKK